MTDEEVIAGFLEVFEKNPQIFVEQPGAVDSLKNLSNTISDIAFLSNMRYPTCIGHRA
jgi:hypothetical protein